MLAKANRVREAADFRATMRFGGKASCDTLVVYLKRDLGDAQARFGFVVSKAVGGAVTRNLVKRRLRATASEILETIPAGYSIVARALPKAGESDWNKLSTDFKSNVHLLIERAGKR